MRKLSYFCILILSLYILSPHCHAENIAFTLSLDKDQVSLGGSVQLSLTLYGVQNVSPPNMPQIDSLHGPINSMPLLVRAGSVVPGWPVMQYTAQRPVERLILHVYPGDGTSWLYEDDGHTWAFQEGQFRVTRLTCETSAQVGGAVLHVRRTAGGPFTPGYERIEVAIHGLTARLEHVSVDGERVAKVDFDPATRTARFHTGLFDLIEATI